jgi:DNA polymerase-3 subunit chi
LTDIAFHFNVPDRLSYVCRLLRKAVGGGARVVVIGPVDALEQLDAALWTLSPTDFIPHCGMDADNAVLSKSTVVLAQSVHTSPFLDILVNLGESVPNGFEQFQRLIEVVTPDAQDRQHARGRWKHYADAGFQLIRHDLQRAST